MFETINIIKITGKGDEQSMAVCKFAIYILGTIGVNSIIKYSLKNIINTWHNYRPNA